MEGERVKGVLVMRQCQAALLAAGFGAPSIIMSRGECGGEFGSPGPLTEDATRTFQVARGLDVTGRFDPSTIAALGVPMADE